MRDRQICFIAIAFALFVLIFYLLHFREEQLSNCTSDWGAFADYMALGVSAVSIALIYITYREQKESNRVMRFEQHILSMINTLNLLSEKCKDRLQEACDMFCKHFLVSFIDLTQCERKKTENICLYYYSSIIVDNHIDEFNNILRYLALSIDHIWKGKSIDEEDKSRQITEFACFLPESLRILFFCWALSNRHCLLKRYFKSGLFMLDGADSSLTDVIKFVCSGNNPKRRKSTVMQESEIKLALEDYSEEQFMDTYNRIYNNK